MGPKAAEPCKHNRKVARPSEIKRKDAVAMANRAVAEKATTRLYETQQDRKKKLILKPRSLPLRTMTGMCLPKKFMTLSRNKSLKTLVLELNSENMIPEDISSFGRPVGEEDKGRSGKPVFFDYHLKM